MCIKHIELFSTENMHENKPKEFEELPSNVNRATEKIVEHRTYEIAKCPSRKTFHIILKLSSTQKKFK